MLRRSSASLCMTETIALNALHRCLILDGHATTHKKQAPSVHIVHTESRPDRLSADPAAYHKPDRIGVSLYDEPLLSFPEASCDCWTGP